MKNKMLNGLLAAAVAMALSACSTAPIAEKAQSTSVQSEVEQVRLLPLEGGRNFRDLGGYETVDGKTVKWGRLYRSGVLTHLTGDDYDYLREREISTIVDFRSTGERAGEPTNWQAGSVMELTWDYDMGNWEQPYGAAS